MLEGILLQLDYDIDIRLFTYTITQYKLMIACSIYLTAFIFFYIFF